LEARLKGITVGGDPVTRSRLERLDSDGLLLEDDDDRFDDCVRALDDLGYGRGSNGAGETALRLLARHFGVPRAKQELIERSEQMQAMSAMLGGLQGLAELNAVASEGFGEPNAPVIAKTMNRVDAAVADIPKGGRVDYTGREIDETQEDRASAINRAVLACLSSQPPGYDDIEKLIDVTRPHAPDWREPGKAAVSVFVADQAQHERVTLPDEMEIAARSLSLFARSFHDYPTRVTSASLEELEAGAAGWMEKLDRMIPGQREREFLAAMLSPIPASIVD
jgi:hypothetical protein